MAKDKKEYNRNYYASHTGIWKRNYAENADARRERARTYANQRWESDPEYRAVHSKNTIERTRLNRQVRSLANVSEKICRVFQKISEKFA
jgi:hypothetical protein